MRRDYRAYLEDIIEAAGAAREFVAGIDKDDLAGDRRTRDAAHHQGTVWGWLIGPFVSAHLRVYRDPTLARSFLSPLIQELDAHCVGSLSEIFDGDPPFTPRGCIAQAWSVAEVLRVWRETGRSQGRGALDVRSQNDRDRV